MGKSFFYSRARTHQLFLMTFPDLRIYQLTDHPQVSFHPRVSPEGERIVFARSQRPWVSDWCSSEAERITFKELY